MFHEVFLQQVNYFSNNITVVVKFIVSNKNLLEAAKRISTLKVTKLLKLLKFVVMKQGFYDDKNLN